MVKYRGFSAWVHVKGHERPLEEFDVQTRKVWGRPEVSCFIPTEEGKKFKVFWKDRAFEKETHGGTEGELLLDGRPCGSCFIIPGKRHQTQDIAWVDGFENEGGEVQPFAFVKAERTEDEEWLVWKELDEHIGEIRVIIRKIKGATSKDPSLRGLNAKEKRQRLQERKERQEMSSRTLVPNIGGKIHEQVKKELHGVRIGYDDS